MGHLAEIEEWDNVLGPLEAARGYGDLQSAAEALRDYFGVSHIVYYWVNARRDFGVGTYSPEWVQQYVTQSYARIDPVVLGCNQRFHPVDWKRLDWTSKAAREFQQEAIKYGVGNQGFAVPIRGPSGQFALFTLSHSCDDETWHDFIETNRREVILLAHVFNQKALELEPDMAPEPLQSLSPRETEAMTLLALGYSRGQIADTLSISEHTLRVYIESARFKLRATNTTHAVSVALARGLIVV